MVYSLDTNVCIRYLKGSPPQLLQKLQAVAASDIAVASIVRAELFYGAAKSSNPIKTLDAQLNFLQPYASLPFDDNAATIFAKERARLESLGVMIGPYDLLIVSIALAQNLILVTHNVREFSRISGLRIEDWEA
jgi:tRNA(fMet)-specific endonuclease VapC